MSEKPCAINFEMSSEEMLGIALQPGDTCDNNHPLDRAMSSVYTTMCTYVVDSPYMENTLEQFEYDENDIVGLQKKIDSFDDWYDDLKGYFHQFIELNLSDAEKAEYERAISLIDRAFHAENDFYYNIDVEKQIQDQKELIEDINAKMRDIFIQYQEMEGRDDDEVEFLKEEADRAVTEYNWTMERFGEKMQNHFTELRQSIAVFKGMVKHHVEALAGKYLINESPFAYPNEQLKTLLKKHKDKDSIITAASPEVFIRKVCQLETEENQLNYDDREALFGNEDSEDCLSIAMKRFSMDYPQYKQLLTYKNSDEARKLGARTSFDFHSSLDQHCDVDSELSY